MVLLLGIDAPWETTGRFHLSRAPGSWGGLETFRPPVYTPPVATNPPQESCNAAFGRSRRWGPHPAKGEAT